MFIHTFCLLHCCNHGTQMRRTCAWRAMDVDGRSCKCIQTRAIHPHRTTQDALGVVSV
jgi:hypothetical protein